jgi:glutaredoxin
MESSGSYYACFFLQSSPAAGTCQRTTGKMPKWLTAMTDLAEKPAGAGPEVTLYQRNDCHLCEEAKTAIAPLLREFGATLREINIEDDETLVQRFGCDIPVIYIGRKKAAKHRVNLEQFRRQLQDASG